MQCYGSRKIMFVNKTCLIAKYTYTIFNVLWYGSRIVPGKKIFYLAAATYYVAAATKFIWRPPLIFCSGRHLIIYRPLLNLCGGRHLILSRGRHLLSGGRHLIIWCRHLVIWRPPLNYRFLDETKFGWYFSMTAVLWPKYSRYSVKHFIIFSMMEHITTAALYFHMGFSCREILCLLAVNHWNVMSRIKKGC